MHAKVFNKGQIVIPVSLRKKCGIRIGEKVDVNEDTLQRWNTHLERGMIAFLKKADYLREMTLYVSGI